MNCSISGEVPEEPVISKKSGLLFEKRLIERHISESGKCPITGELLTNEDIIPIKTGKIVKPHPVQAASFPDMLSMIRKDWDHLTLSNFALEEQLRTAEQKYVAACLEITSLKKERDEARTQLSLAKMQFPISTSANIKAVASNVKRGRKRASDGEDLGPPYTKKARIISELKDRKIVVASDGKVLGPDTEKACSGISGTIISELKMCNAELSRKRKNRQIPTTPASTDTVERYTQISIHPLHISKPGILSIDIHRSKDIIATGGVDTNAVVFDRSAGQIISTLSGHSEKITSVRFVDRDDILLTGSADKTVRIWQGSENGDYNCRHILKGHSAEIEAVTVNATNKYFVTASRDSTWCFYDLSAGECLMQVSDPSESEGYTSAAFHPDGLILGIGTAEALVRIWDVTIKKNVASFRGHNGPVTAVSFSEGGYFLATAASDGVKLWDLRILRNFHTISPYEAQTHTNSVDFDHSGNYLALAGSDMRVYQVANVKSEWNCVKAFPDLSGTGKVNSVKFGPAAKYLAVGSMDENLRIFALPVEDNSDS